MRFIIHDWADAYAKKILKHLRASALPSTKLILYDFLVPYAASTGGLFSDIPGSQVPVAPYPLLPNLGNVSNQTVLVDLQVLIWQSNYRSSSLQGDFLDDGCNELANWTVYWPCQRYGMEIGIHRLQFQECNAGYPKLPCVCVCFDVPNMYLTRSGLTKCLTYLIPVTRNLSQSSSCNYITDSKMLFIPTIKLSSV